MKLKKMLALILALAMALSLAACGGGGSTESQPPEQQSSAPDDKNDAPAPAAAGDYMGENINVAIQADGGTMDPFASFVNWGQAAMTGLIYESLISLDFDYNVYYLLAKSIEQVDDTHWDVEICSVVNCNYREPLYIWE